MEIPSTIQIEEWEINGGVTYFLQKRPYLVFYHSRSTDREKDLSILSNSKKFSDQATNLPTSSRVL